MALVTAALRSQAERRLSGEFLIAEGRAWGQRRDLRLDQSLALEVGFTLHFLGDSVDLLASVYNKLGLAYTIETGTTGRRYARPDRTRTGRNRSGGGGEADGGAQGRETDQARRAACQRTSARRLNVPRRRKESQPPRSCANWGYRR